MPALVTPFLFHFLPASPPVFSCLSSPPPALTGFALKPLLHQRGVVYPFPF